MHAALADVAAAKARMFVNKPDGSTLLFPTFSIYMFLLNQELFLKNHKLSAGIALITAALPDQIKISLKKRYKYLFSLMLGNDVLVFHDKTS